MRIRISDSILAGLMSCVLIGIAAGAVFGFQHGFEEQIGWLKFLLPGVWIAGPITNAMNIANPAVGNFIFQTLLSLVSFAWYFGISFLVVKMYRFIGRF